MSASLLDILLSDLPTSGLRWGFGKPETPVSGNRALSANGVSVSNLELSKAAAQQVQVGYGMAARLCWKVLSVVLKHKPSGLEGPLEMGKAGAFSF